MMTDALPPDGTMEPHRFDAGDVRASCDGKTVYVTANKAWTVATRMRRDGEAVDVYRCRHCQMHHLGRSANAPKRRSRSRTRRRRQGRKG